MCLYLGIDLGTSSIKISLGDENGKIIDSISKSYPIYFSNENWSEQNPDDWFNALISSLKELNLKYNIGDVASLSFSGQMHGLVILDENDKVIRNAILWNDSRVQKEVDYLNKIIGKEKLISETGNIALCGFTAPKLLWIKNNEPNNFNKISKIMLPKDYLAYKLSGSFCSDITDLSGTLFFDVKNQKYSTFMLNLLGINVKQLPIIKKTYEQSGFVLPIYQNICGLNPSTKVIIGGGDQAIGAVGTNTLNEGEISISLGTSGVVFAPSKIYRFDKLGRIHSFCQANGSYHLMGCTLSAMGSLKWFFEDILELDSYFNELDKINLDSINDVIFLPYLCGERSPINDPNAKGEFVNLSLTNKRSDLVKSLIEGIVFSLYDVYLVMKEGGFTADFARVIGGGSKSEKILQILSDVFGIEMRTINASDGAALGALIIAMVGDGKYSSIEEACSKIIKDKLSFKPNLKRHDAYVLKFKKYKEAYLKSKLEVSYETNI